MPGALGPARHLPSGMSVVSIRCLTRPLKWSELDSRRRGVVILLLVILLMSLVQVGLTWEHFGFLVLFLFAFMALSAFDNRGLHLATWHGDPSFGYWTILCREHRYMRRPELGRLLSHQVVIRYQDPTCHQCISLSSAED